MVWEVDMQGPENLHILLGQNFEHFRCISTVAREQLSVENLLHKMEVALDFLPAGSYAAIDVTHSQKITNVHSPPDREGGV